ncbi:hypothetical protein PHMEG_00024910 [Phytophthora megakarya]|uniref:Uncharacterized protein n=1 Tax=Phytophthora megakarya TaxID=4795 RepID=A0A225VFU5_9STRA|nr:hypothetical protein PHMEG_00024910 [Phytophthora megakarya]
MSAVALFTNPQGVYNTYSGTWDPPTGRVWNGKYWAPKSTKQRKRSNSETSGGKEPKKSVMEAKLRRESSSDDEAFAIPKKKKVKAAVKQAVAPDKMHLSRPPIPTNREHSAGSAGVGEIKCYNCGQTGACPNGTAQISKQKPEMMNTYEIEGVRQSRKTSDGRCNGLQRPGSSSDPQVMTTEKAMRGNEWREDEALSDEVRNEYENRDLVTIPGWRVEAGAGG